MAAPPFTSYVTSAEVPVKGAAAGERFHYLYSAQELGEWLAAIERLAGETRGHTMSGWCAWCQADSSGRLLQKQRAQNNVLNLR